MCVRVWVLHIRRHQTVCTCVFLRLLSRPARIQDLLKPGKANRVEQSLWALSQHTAVICSGRGAVNKWVNWKAHFGSETQGLIRIPVRISYRIKIISFSNPLFRANKRKHHCAPPGSSPSCLWPSHTYCIESVGHEATRATSRCLCIVSPLAGYIAQTDQLFSAVELLNVWEPVKVNELRKLLW